MEIARERAEGARDARFAQHAREAAAAGLLAPMLATHPEINRNLLVLSLGFGSLILSHLNDGGFWIVKDCLGLTVAQTLRTWTVTETILSVSGLGFTLLLSLVF